jgi:hypothetical protein
METTRKELEKLTTSDDFKRHQARKQREARKGAASRSLMDAYEGVDDSVADLRQNSQLRQN